VRQLRMPLQSAAPRQGLDAQASYDADPQATEPGELMDWARCVRRTSLACLLVGIDGHLIAISEAARDMLGDNARPGLSETTWWLEEFPHSQAPARERSLLARAAASGTPGHSVVQLHLPDGMAMVQVLVAPLETTGAATDALLVFVRPVAALSAH